MANAQRSGIIEGILIKEVNNAKTNINCDNLHYIYVQNHKTGSLQAAIIYLEAEIYDYLYTFVTILLPLLPCIQHSRYTPNCRVFQTWFSDKLRTSTISSCLRIGLKLFGIDDPHGCPTNYRKAASTLISIHQPSMQEPLSQFMCHARSTTERHYRHHMSHRGLSTVFNELAKCQTLPTEGRSTTSPKKYGTDLRSSVNNAIDCGSVRFSEDMSNKNLEILNSEDNLDITLASIFEDSLNISGNSDESCLDVNSDLQVSPTEGLKLSSISTISSQSSDLIPSQFHKPARYACKRNGKSIFADQDEEDTFFQTFDSLIDKALHNQPVTACEVLLLASNSEQFRSLWDGLVLKFGDTMALKKVTDKIRRFARNNRGKI